MNRLSKLVIAAAFALGLALPAIAQDLPDLGGRTIVAVTENAYVPLNFADPKTAGSNTTSSTRSPDASTPRSIGSFRAGT